MFSLGNGSREARMGKGPQNKDNESRPSERKEHVNLI